MYFKQDFFFSSDPVEFQMSFDRRTGKPIAVSVIKMEKGSVSYEVLSENRVSGTVMTEAKPNKQRNVSDYCHSRCNLNLSYRFLL